MIARQEAGVDLGAFRNRENDGRDRGFGGGLLAHGVCICGGFLDRVSVDDVRDVFGIHSSRRWSSWGGAE